MQRMIRFLLACAFVLFSAYESGAWLRYVDRVSRHVDVRAMQIVREDAIARARVALLLALVFQAIAVLVIPIYLPKWPKEKDSPSSDALFVFARWHPMTFVYSLRFAATLLAMVLAMFSYYFISHTFGIKLFTLP